MLAESVDDVMNTLDNQITEQYIFVVYSLAGGTGSGLGTFLASVIAENPNKKVGLVIILPSMNESLQARINTYEALSEIIEIKNELCSIFILDNNQREDKFSINLPLFLLPYGSLLYQESLTYFLILTLYPIVSIIILFFATKKSGS